MLTGLSKGRIHSNSLKNYHFYSVWWLQLHHYVCLLMKHRSLITSLYSLNKRLWNTYLLRSLAGLIKSQNPTATLSSDIKFTYLKHLLNKEIQFITVSIWLRCISVSEAQRWFHLLRKWNSSLKIKVIQKGKSSRVN